MGHPAVRKILNADRSDCPLCLRALKNRGIPPPPSIFRIIMLARNSRQNPDGKELKGQNLDNKGLRSIAAAVVCTASALVMIG